MKIEDFARTILFGTSLEDKLIQPPLFTPEFMSDEKHRVPTVFAQPVFPGRPLALSRIGRAAFPSLQTLQSDEARGRLLHFFANHELLALELMALAILKFPDSPFTFRKGLADTILEEQRHMRLYIERMKTLGVEFGDLPFSDYFWNCMKDLATPIEFITAMSLTFEQANLDYSLSFKKIMHQIGDTVTAELLDLVYREELGHVKHGLIWFNRWREAPDTETDWDAYKRILPAPLTPRRAKGFDFSEEARVQVGFSSEYISALKLCSDSKGRPPTVWYFNPACEGENQRGAPGFTPSAVIQNLSIDLEVLLMHLAVDPDHLLVREKPRQEWLLEMHEKGFHIPVFITDLRALGSRKLSGIEPWGWSPDCFEKFRPYLSQLTTPLPVSPLLHATFASKAWSTEFFKNWLTQNPASGKFFGSLHDCGHTLDDFLLVQEKVEQALAQENNSGIVLKAPFGTAGNQVKRVRQRSDWNERLQAWIKKTIYQQKQIILEPLLNKEADLSIQFEITDQHLKIFEPHVFLTNSVWQYQGTFLSQKWYGLSSDALRFLNHNTPDSPLTHWKKMIESLALTLRSQGYRGPAGVDALIWRRGTGELQFKPLIELNPRYTMGRVALAFEKHILPGKPAFWGIVSLAVLQKRGFASFTEWTAQVQNRHPEVWHDYDSKKRLSSGVIFTNDPVTAREVLSFLCVGPWSELSLIQAVL